MQTFNRKTDSNWLPKSLEALQTDGYAIIEGVLEKDFIKEIEEHMYSVQKKIVAAIGQDRLDRAGELGVLRIMVKYDSFFLKCLEVPEVLEVIDKTVSSTGILHVQQGSILPSFPPGQAPPVFQNIFHMDFPRVLNGYMASVNAFFAISPFTKENGGTVLVRSSHQKLAHPTEEYIKTHAEPVECVSGSVFLFDSTLYHAAGSNTSGKDRLGINHQFTRSFFKQQIDYVRALDPDMVQTQKPRTQQLLGWYTRTPSSLDEYYRPTEERLYRKNQG